MHKLCSSDNKRGQNEETLSTILPRSRGTRRGVLLQAKKFWDNVIDYRIDAGCPMFKMTLDESHICEYYNNRSNPHSKAGERDDHGDLPERLLSILSCEISKAYPSNAEDDWNNQKP